MLSKSKPQNQRDLFRPLISDFIDMSHELVLLAQKIDWNSLEKSLSVYYSHTGTKSMPIRLMAGCLMLKRLYNLGDETVAQAWEMNAYFQYFCGASTFEHKFPCDPSDFVHFRQRIGTAGAEIIFAHSVALHGKKALKSTSLQDTTVQENNTTFPTDAKLAKKVIDKCNDLAKKEGITQRQNYKRISKSLLRDCYNSQHPKRFKRAKRARKKLKTIANRLLRELERTLPKARFDYHKETLKLYFKAVNQQRTDKNKIYSLHKPFTACIAKGKAHKKYEFGNKIGLMVEPKSKIIQAIDAYVGNPHDSRTIERLLNQSERLLSYKPQEVVYDRGGRGKKNINGVSILTPDNGRQKQTDYQKRKKRKKFRQRAGIEPIIGHLKQYYRMGQNYLHGESAPKMNALLAATGWNLKQLMKSLKKDFLCLVFSYKNHLKKRLLNFIFRFEVSC